MTLELPNLSIYHTGTLSGVPFVALKEKILGKRYELSISFVSPRIAQTLNKTHRNKTYTPNTLSFSLTKQSGEIILCRSALRKEYKKFGMSYQTYLVFILIHSMLHLKGFVHGGTMERKEKMLLASFTKHTDETPHRRRH